MKTTHSLSAAATASLPASLAAGSRPADKSAAWAKALRSITGTASDAAPLVARLTLGLVLFPHGAQKALGWFGGYGFTGTMNYFTGTLHIPAVFAFAAIATEFAGSLALLSGLFSRVAAFATGVVMLVAVYLGHAENGFFMNWTGTQAGEGFEYHLLVLGLALIVVLRGGGKASLDRLISRGERA